MPVSVRKIQNREGNFKEDTNSSVIQETGVNIMTSAIMTR